MSVLFLAIVVLAGLGPLTSGDEYLPQMSSLTELAAFWGFELETHDVVTEDGYILEIDRLPKSGEESFLGSAKSNKPVVFIQHGLESASSKYILGPSGKSLCYVLADAGYDVWMGNTRGNTYSRRHITLDPDVDKAEFWNFEWELVGERDLAAAFDYVVQTTGQSEFFYVGTSMGATQFLTGMIERPELQQYIKEAFLMAPVAYMTLDEDMALCKLSHYWRELEVLFEAAGIWEWMGDQPITSDLAHNRCSSETFEQNEDFCLSAAGLFFSISEGQLNTTMLPWYFDYYPEGTSVKAMVHYAQEINRRGYFSKYDFGSEENLEIYGSEVPPEYDLTLMSVPVHLFYGDGDTLATVQDVERLANELPNVVSSLLVPHPGWSHQDFALGIDAKELVYDLILSYMEENP